MGESEGVWENYSPTLLPAAAADDERQATEP